MRVVWSVNELSGAFRVCQEEARKAFAGSKIFIQRYLASPRHVEIKIITDHHGNVLHLGERECSPRCSASTRRSSRRLPARRWTRTCVGAWGRWPSP
ncbi:hypothetical protein DFAR_720008 [Desulfarculales bacterium]